MEERYLSFKEIKEVFLDKHYEKLFDEVHFVVGEDEIIQTLESKFDCTVEMKKKDGMIYPKHSGLWFRKKKTNNVLNKLSCNSIDEFKVFKTKDELIAFLDHYIEQCDEYIYIEKYKLNEKTKDYLKKQAELLSSEQKEALIVYKSRMFQIMNSLWKIYKRADDCDVKYILKILNTDYSNINNEFLSNEERINLQRKIILKNAIKESFLFFKKAQNNSKNADFFNQIPNINLNSEKDFIVSIVAAMKNMESIDQILAPEDLKLFRGIYGRSILAELGESVMSSCSPNLIDPIRFAIRYSTGGFRSFGSNALISIKIKEGMPIIPMFFSVKTTIKGVDSETAALSKIDYNALADDAIEIRVEEKENIQDEIVLNGLVCKIPTLTEWPEDKIETVTEYTRTLIDCEKYILIKKETNEHIEQDMMWEIHNFINDEFCVCIGSRSKRCVCSYRPTYSHSIYKNVEIDELVSTSNVLY